MNIVFPFLRLGLAVFLALWLYGMFHQASSGRWGSVLTCAFAFAFNVWLLIESAIAHIRADRAKLPDPPERD